MDKAKITPAPADDYLTKAFAAAHPDGCACKVVSPAQAVFYLLLALFWLFLLKYRWDLFVFGAAAILGDMHRIVLRAEAHLQAGDLARANAARPAEEAVRDAFEEGRSRDVELVSQGCG